MDKGRGAGGETGSKAVVIGTEGSSSRMEEDHKKKRRPRESILKLSTHRAMRCF
jgi:hypothetical protein